MAKIDYRRRISSFKTGYPGICRTKPKDNLPAGYALGMMGWLSVISKNKKQPPSLITDFDFDTDTDFDTDN